MIPIAHPIIGEEERRAVLAVLDSGQLAQGPRVAELERRWALATGAYYAVACSSGTAALHLALMAHGISKGDEVITTPFSFVATVNAILMVGATPVFVDVEEDTGNIDAAQVGRAITKHTRAILPVHLYGLPCELDYLSASYDMLTIHDACQAVGATFEGYPIGAWAASACYSLYATKNVQCGEGGMVTTNAPEVAEWLRILRNQGQRGRYEYIDLGYNYRLTDLQAAIALCQLDHLKEWTEKRRANAAYLSANIDNPRVIKPGRSRGHAWHQYTVRIPEGRTGALAQLHAAGIGAAVYYPQALNTLPHVRQVVGDVHMPVAERLAGEVLSLPVHPGLTREELERIVEGVNAL